MPTIYTLQCSFCSKAFLRTKKDLNKSKKQNSKNSYCTKLCKNLASNAKTKYKCHLCQKMFVRKTSSSKNSKLIFCSRACNAKHYNANKQYGNRISKLEIWCQKELAKQYQNLEFHFNRKDAINSELDIYIPSLKLAFELNGIFHYEPIFGKLQLSKIQNNDSRKFQACIERSISLCIIDTSSQKYFKEASSKKYLDIITNLIDEKFRKTD